MTDRLAEAERMPAGAARRAALAEIATELWGDARRIGLGESEGDEQRVRALGGAVLDLAAAEG